MGSQRPLHWKFSRDGAYSTTYVSFIFDIPSTQLNEESKVWQASFDQLSKVLLLLQDVELLNKGNLLKPAFIDAVLACGYQPPTTALQLRDSSGLVSGSAVIGRHNGAPIPFGFYADDTNSPLFDLDVSTFTPALLLSGDRGEIIRSWKGPKRANSDLLACYREIECFDPKTQYWDLMPKHAHMQSICHAIKTLDPARAEQFLTQTLQWSNPQQESVKAT